MTELDILPISGAGSKNKIFNRLSGRVISELPPCRYYQEFLEIPHGTLIHTYQAEISQGRLKPF
jgi:glycine cleavage system pyridoxal-binding protein P